MRLGVTATACAALLLGTCSAVEAQSIRGRVVDAATSRPLDGVVVEAVRDAATVGRALTDSAGRFALHFERGGTYHLTASSLGYGDVGSGAIAVGGRELVHVTLTLSMAPVPIEGVTVEARRTDPRHEASFEGFLARRATAYPVGPERVVVRGDHEMAGTSNVREVLRWFARPRKCVTYYVDGERRKEIAWGILDMPVTWLDGIEYYKDGIFAPFGYEAPPQCSVVAVWRRGSAMNGPGRVP